MPKPRTDRSELVRRAFHLSSPLWLVWYWVPPDAWVGVAKEIFLLLFLGVGLGIEAFRLLSGRRLLGFRANEIRRMSAAAWGAIGLAIGLLFFPGELVIPTFWGMAWIDPLCRFARKEGHYPHLPLAMYILVWAFFAEFLVPLAPYGTRILTNQEFLIAPLVAAVVAIAAEAPSSRYVDDDFLMFVAPLLVLAGLFAVV